MSPDHGQKNDRTISDAPHVSNKEATDRVIDVMLSDGDPESKAFGRTSDDWIELLLGFMAAPWNRRFVCFAFAVLLGKNNSSLPYYMHNEVGGFIGDHANKWLAEADSDELEREGFL